MGWSSWVWESPCAGEEGAAAVSQPEGPALRDRRPRGPGRVELTARAVPNSRVGAHVGPPGPDMGVIAGELLVPF